MNEDDNIGRDEGLAGIGDLAGFFAPSWAKDEENGQVRIVKEGYGPHGEGARRDRDGLAHDVRRERRRGEGGAPGDDRHHRGDRPRHDDRQHGGERRNRDERQPQGMAGRGDGAQRRQSAPRAEVPLSLQVRFLPDSKSLDAIIHRIQATHKAYPFRDIVRLFQKDDSSLSVRIERREGQAESEVRIWQCGKCSRPALSEADLVAHITSDHFADFFDAEEVEVDAPKGNFPCVARCGLTGELLGPPNHHSYAEKVRQMLRDRFPGMSEDEYRSRIEMVRDAESIEQWRESARKRTMYFRKDGAKPVHVADAAAQEAAADAPAGAAEAAADASEAQAAVAPEPERVGLPRQEAEAIFRAEILPKLITGASHVVCRAVALKNMSDRRFAAFLSREFAKDEAMRSQGSLARAIHAAFHHRGLHFFRANDERGQEFTSAIVPQKADLENVTDEIRAIVEFAAQNPCCQRKTLVEAVAGEIEGDRARRVSASLRWLVDKGHVVEFFNGTLTVGAAHPIFSNSPRKPAANGKGADAQPSPRPAAVDPAPSGDEAGADGQPSQQPAAVDPAPSCDEAGADAQPSQQPAAVDPAPSGDVVDSKQ